MDIKAVQLLNQALLLDIRERGEFAAELIASMDGDPDADVDEARAMEIERRALRAHHGEARGEDWDAVRARIEDKLRTQ